MTKIVPFSPSYSKYEGSIFETQCICKTQKRLNLVCEVHIHRVKNWTEIREVYYAGIFSLHLKSVAVISCKSKTSDIYANCIEHTTKLSSFSSFK